MNNKVNLQVLTVSLGKILAMLATFIVPVVLTRFLSKDDYGIYGQFNVVFLFCSAFFSLGIRSNLYYFYPNSNSSYRKVLVFQTFGMLFILSLLAAIIIITPFLNSIFIGTNQLLSFKYYIAVVIILYMVSTIMEPLYILRKDNILSVSYPGGLVALKGLTIVIFVILVPSIESVLTAVILVFLVAFLFSIYYILKEIKYQPSDRLISLKILKEQITYSLPFGLSVSLKSIITKLDKILCISFISPKEYAIYTVSFLAIPGIQAIYDSLVQVYIIEMSKAFKKGDINEINNIYHDLLTKSFSYTLPSVIIIFYYADFVISTLYTDAYIEAVPLFRLYILGSITMVLGAGVVLRSIGKTKLTLKSYILSSFITIPITYFLVSNFGLTGAMTSAIVAMIVPKLFLFYYDISELKTSLFAFFPLKNLFLISLISIMAIVPIFLYNQIYSQTWLSILVSSAIYMLLVFYLEYKSNLFVIESKIVDNMISKIKKRFD